MLSIQQKFRLEISETSRAQWNLYSGFKDPTQAAALRLNTQKYTLKEKSKYCLFPKEHSTVEKGRWKNKGGGILFRVETTFLQAKSTKSMQV